MSWNDRKEWRTRNKAEWGAGPWTDEPDKVQWVDDATGLDCLIVRNRLGALCGYVGVPEDHPFFGVEYVNCRLRCECEDRDEEFHYCVDSYLDVHGGRTFSGYCHEPTEDEWLGIEAAASAKRLVDEAARFPRGDAARRIAELREQSGMTLDGWRDYQMARRICHVPEPGRPARVFWLGFDCGHLHDLIPGMRDRVGICGDDVYRTVEYVRGECAHLAEQLVTGRPAERSAVAG